MKKTIKLLLGFGVVVGAVYLMFKKKGDGTQQNSTDKDAEENHETKPHAETAQGEQTVDDMFQDKAKSAQDIVERHSEAVEVMREAYSNIMEDFTDDIIPDENNADGESETEENMVGDASDSTIVDDASDSTMEKWKQFRMS